jgi:hypothetical protein
LSILPVRFRVPPEIVILTLRSGSWISDWKAEWSDQFSMRAEAN